MSSSLTIETSSEECRFVLANDGTRLEGSYFSIGSYFIDDEIHNPYRLGNDSWLNNCARILPRALEKMIEFSAPNSVEVCAAINKIPIAEYYWRTDESIVIEVQAPLTASQRNKAYEFFCSNASSYYGLDDTLILINNYWPSINKEQYGAAVKAISDQYYDSLLIDPSFGELERAISQTEKQLKLILVIHGEIDGTISFLKPEKIGQETISKNNFAPVYDYGPNDYTPRLLNLVPKIESALLFNCYGGTTTGISGFFQAQHIPTLGWAGLVHFDTALEKIRQILHV